MSSSPSPPRPAVQPRRYTPVAVIGGGLAGLTLALTLHQHNVHCIVYESSPRDAPIHKGGSVMASPNALRILDNLGVYDDLKSQAFTFESMTFKDYNHITTGTYHFGNAALYSYPALRTYRNAAINVLRARAADCGITTEYNKPFSRLLRETSFGTEFEFADGSRAIATVLIGADGIHSRLRDQLFPGSRPLFQGFVGIFGVVAGSSLSFPLGTDQHTYGLPSRISEPSGSSVLLAPQDPDGASVVVGRKMPVSLPSATEPADFDIAAWKGSILTDRTRLLAFFRQDGERFPALVQSALENVDLETFNIWPYYNLPDLAHWSTRGGHVALVGDAAQAINPTTGLGINQAVEDGFVLGLALAQTRELVGSGSSDESRSSGEGENGAMEVACEQQRPKLRLRKALSLWEGYRRHRVEGVKALAGAMARRGVSTSIGEEVAGVAEEEGPRTMSWLYGTDVEIDFWGWVAAQEEAV